MLGRLALAAVIAACGDPPPLTIKYKLSSSASQQCLNANKTPAQSCTDVGLPCEMYLSVRIVSPRDPTQAFVSVCQAVNGRHDLCSIAGIDLPDGVSIPEQTLQVQVALYDASDLPRDDTGEVHCPADPQFSPDGLPVTERSLTGDPPPAVGGMAFYHPGDEQTVIALGCTDPPALQACMQDNSVDVTATVNDFDIPISVPRSIADSLEVLVGEPGPTINPNEYVLSPSNTRPLDPVTGAQPPQWGATLDPLFMSSACVEVLEDGPEIRPTLTCRPVSTMDHMLDLTGVRVQLATIDGLLKLVDPMHTATLPAGGIVIGMVLDSTGTPIPNMTVTPSTMATIQYVSPDRTQLVLGGTSTSGIFISLDAPYGTSFSAHGASMLQMATGFGGLVHGKVNVVVLQFDKPQGS
jgi:hypothetical protein